jgi:hypothetical protein
MIQAINGKNGEGEIDMPLLQSKPRPGPAPRRALARISCVAIVATFFVLLCGTAHPEAELPALKGTGPSTFRGEIAKGLKIEMRLYRDGSSLHGSYSYEVFGRDLQVKGTINERGDIALQEFVNGKVTGNFEGRFVTKDRIEGRWFKKSPEEKGRSFYLVGTGGPLAAAVQAPVTPKPSRSDREASPVPKETRSAPKPEAVGKPAPMTAEAHPQVLPTVKQPSTAATREVPVAQPESKAEAKAQPAKQASAPQQPSLKTGSAQAPSAGHIVLRPVVAEESPKLPAKAEIRPEEKPRVAGRSADPVKKKSSTSWLNLPFSMQMGGAIGGILLLGGGLAWLAVVAGGAAAFRENSALFRQAHAMGVSFLPGIFLLALGVGAVLAVFVE